MGVKLLVFICRNKPSSWFQDKYINITLPSGSWIVPYLDLIRTRFLVPKGKLEDQANAKWYFNVRILASVFPFPCFHEMITLVSPNCHQVSNRKRIGTFAQTFLPVVHTFWAKSLLQDYHWRNVWTIIFLKFWKKTSKMELPLFKCSVNLNSLGILWFLLIAS